MFDLNKTVKTIDDTLTEAWKSEYSEDIKKAKKALTELTEEYLRVRSEARRYKAIITGDTYEVQ